MAAFVNGGVRLSGNRKSGRSKVCGTRQHRGVFASAEVTIWGDGTDGSACPPAETELVKQYGSLRGKEIPTVTDTMQKFNDTFRRPVPAVYRGIVNELITLTHLSTVCALWRYDALFAFGCEEIFKRYFAYYPNERERETLQRCIFDSMPNLSLDQLKTDAAAVKSYIEGKNESQLLELLEAGSEDGPVLKALQYVKNANAYNWYYSRNFGFGLIFVIEAMGGEINDANAERWANAIKISPMKLKDEVGVYLSSLEKLKQAEQMFADLAARDKKKLAEQLQEQAAAAKAEASEAEKEAEAS